MLFHCHVATWTTPLAPEDRTARLTILIDPRKKALFERLCAEEDATPSQVVRRLIRQYIEQKTGRPWNPEEETVKRTAKGSSRRTART
jgi:Ribbon-helix-helix protein